MTDTFSLPDGSSWTVPADTSDAARAAAWVTWRRLARLALERGEGVRVHHHDTGEIELETVYAPRFEAHRIVVSPDGEVTWCSEQSAPDLAEPTDADLIDPLNHATPFPRPAW